MKIKLSILLVAGMVTIVPCSLSAQTKNDLTLLNLKGKIKTIIQSRFKAVDKFGIIQKGELELKQKTLFNERGNKSEVNEYNLDGSLKEKDVYKYDTKGNVIEVNNYRYDGSLSNKFIYKYDEKGNKIEYCSYNSDGSIFQKLTYNYDIIGNMIEENNCISDGTSCQRTTNKYDDKGNKIEWCVYWKDTLDWKDNYVNDDNGNIIKMSRYYPAKGTTDSSIFKYDALGNKIAEKDYLSDGTLFQNFAYKYDNKGNEVEMDFCDSIGVVTRKDTTKYEYDKTGNWLKKTELQGYFPYLITEREIEYYLN